MTVQAGLTVITWSGLRPVGWFVLWRWWRWFLINVFIFNDNFWSLGVFILVLKDGRADII